MHAIFCRMNKENQVVLLKYLCLMTPIIGGRIEIKIINTITKLKFLSQEGLPLAVAAGITTRAAEHVDRVRLRRLR